MKKIFLLLFLFSFGIAHSQYDPIVKVIKTSQSQFTGGAQSGAFDDFRGYAINDSIYVLIGGTDNVTVFNYRWKSGDKGINWIQQSDGIWAIRNAMGVANNPAVMWGGNGVSVFRDSYGYTPAGGETQISSNMGATYGTTRQQFAYTQITRSPRKYLTLGGQNINTVVESTDLMSWTTTGTLPVPIQNTGGMTATYDSANNYVYIVGGKQGVTNLYPGTLYRSSDGGATWPDSLTASFFADQWPNMVCLTWGFLYLRGHNGVANQQGLYFCPITKNPLVEANWQRLIYEVPPRHATCFFTNQDRTEAYLVGGNFWNDSYLIKCISCH